MEITRTRTITPDLLNILSRCYCHGSQLRISETLDRNQYTKLNEVLEALGGKWSRGQKAHVFTGLAAEAVEAAIMTESYTRTKQDFGFFETPARLAAQLIHSAHIMATHRVLEPSAGTGSLAWPASRSCAELVCVEIQVKNAVVLERLLPAARVEMGDFLMFTPEQLGLFDRVVMNPPFARRDDIRHIQHAYKFLRPGGRLVSIASSSVTFRDDFMARNFRGEVQDCGGQILMLPEGSFKASGTMVNACVVTMERK